MGLKGALQMEATLEPPRGGLLHLSPLLSLAMCSFPLVCDLILQGSMHLQQPVGLSLLPSLCQKPTFSSVEFLERERNVQRLSTQN